MENPANISSYTSSFLNSCGIKIFCKYWEPKRPRAIVFLLHGYAEHCLPYEPLAKTLASNGYFVMTHDHMGHGQSGGSRALVDNFQKYVDDVFRHIEIIKKKYEKLDFYLCGHSMGGAIAILSYLCRKEYFKGLLLIGPAIKTNPELTTPLRVHLAMFLRWFAPQFPVATLDLNKVCSSAENVKLLKKDSLRYHGFCKAATGASLIEAMKKIQDHVPEIVCPFIICQGEDDQICEPVGASFMYERSPSSDKSIKVYPHAFHSLLHEPDGIAEQVITDLVDWLNLRSNI